MRQRGFTLIEVAVVLFVMGIILAMAASLLRSLTSSSQSKLTTTVLQNADQGLSAFVTLAKRLPCPADGSLASTDPGYGVEKGPLGACANGEARGVVPWVTLGMSPTDVTDGYGNLITYRVDPQLTVVGAMDLTQCDAGGGTKTDGTKASRCITCDGTVALPKPPLGVGIPGECTGPSTAIAGRGLRTQDAVVLAPGQLPIQDPLGAPPLGAAYVLVSHGANMGRGYTAQGGLNPGTQPLGDGEIQNGADNALQAAYIDAAPSATFDDQLLHPTILSVANRAGLGPRTHAIPP